MIKAKIFECTGGYSQEEENLNKFLVELQESKECNYIDSIHVRKNSIVIFYEFKDIEAQPIEVKPSLDVVEESISQEKTYTIEDYIYTPSALTFVTADAVEDITIEY